jgi:hypothetical protein
MKKCKTKEIYNVRIGGYAEVQICKYPYKPVNTYASFLTGVSSSGPQISYPPIFKL